MLNNLGHFENRCVARCLSARLIEARLEGVAAQEAYKALAIEADNDWPQLRWLLVQQSKLVH